MLHKAKLLSYIKQHDLRVVFLWRRNILRQLISREVLKKTAIPHPKKSSDVRTRPVQPPRSKPYFGSSSPA